MKCLQITSELGIPHGYSILKKYEKERAPCDLKRTWPPKKGLVEKAAGTFKTPLTRTRARDIAGDH